VATRLASGSLCRKEKLGTAATETAWILIDVITVRIARDAEVNAVTRRPASRHESVRHRTQSKKAARHARSPDRERSRHVADRDRASAARDLAFRPAALPGLPAVRAA
jgi:hypothetical protein